MKLPIILPIAAVALGLSQAALGQSPFPTVVTTASGALQGGVAAGVLSFKGIPFAAPPVGGLRWRPPQPVTPWAGIRSALQYGSDPMQIPFPGDAAPIGAPVSEDCLYLNVWRPATQASQPLAVLVWIFGGGFVNGGASAPVLDGSAFARRGIVLVSFNYRLGRLGYFAHPALTREHPSEAHANYGLLDQIAALEWVQRNIPAFGGDRTNVTIFGESAGGLAVHQLLTTRRAAGLYRRAIIQSGGGRGLLAGENLRRAESKGVVFAQQHGIAGDGPQALNALRNLSAQSIVADLNLPTRVKVADSYSGPTVDGVVVTKNWEEAYRSNDFNPVPIMVGGTSSDLGMAPEPTAEAALAAFGSERDRAAVVYGGGSRIAGSEIAILVARDAAMLEPARFVARCFAATNTPVFYFRFSYVEPRLLTDIAHLPPPIRAMSVDGAPHASDVPYVFATTTSRYGQLASAQTLAVASLMNQYWANFAKNGDPNGKGLPVWPRFTAKNDLLMDFGADAVARAQPDPWRERLDLAATLAK